MRNLRKRRINFLDLRGANSIVLQKAFNRVTSSGNFILNKEVENFEKKFSQYLKIKYCIGVGNGLEAIQIALMALGIGRNDEIITTPISAAATALAILAVGAKPVFVDTTKEGLLNSDLIVPAITKRTKAILPVHLYGNPLDLKKIYAICGKNKLFLVEDAAQAHGSIYKGRRLGTFGKLGCFSFYPTKNLGAFGDGGAIVTNSLKLARICREIRDYGQTGKYVHIRYGLNSRLDEIQAAFLNVKLKTLDKENNQRKILAKRYIKKLSKIATIEIITSNLENSNFHQFVIKVEKRNNLQKFLRQNGIQTLIHYPIIIPDQLFLKEDYADANLPVARSFVKSCLSLPCYPQMNLDDVEYISEQIIKFYNT